MRVVELTDIGRSNRLGGFPSISLQLPPCSLECLPHPVSNMMTYFSGDSIQVTREPLSGDRDTVT